MKMEQIECSETSAYINQTPGNHPKENTQHSDHGESLKSRILHLYGEETVRNFRLFKKHHFTPAYEDGTDRVFRNVGIYKSDAGKSPKRKHTTFMFPVFKRHIKIAI